MQTISARCKFPLPILFLVIGHPHLCTLKSSQPDKLNWLIVMHCTYYCTYSRKCSTHLTHCFFNPSKNKKNCYNFIHWNTDFGKCVELTFQHPLFERYRNRFFKSQSSNAEKENYFIPQIYIFQTDHFVTAYNPLVNINHIESNII